MKNRFIISLVLLFLSCLFLEAQSVIRSRRMASGSMTSDSTLPLCSTSDTTNVHNVLLEGFQVVSGYDNTWETNGVVGNLDAGADSTALIVGKPTGACYKAFKLTVPVNGIETYIQYETNVIDLDTYSVDILFYLYIDTPSANMDNYAILLADDGTFACCYVKVTFTAGNPTVAITGSTTSSSDTLVLGQWNKILVHLDIVGANSYMIINDGSQLTFTRVAATDFTRLKIGTTYILDPGDFGTLYFDLICVNKYIP